MGKIAKSKHIGKRKENSCESSILLIWQIMEKIFLLGKLSNLFSPRLKSKRLTDINKIEIWLKNFNDVYNREGNCNGKELILSLIL